MNLREQSKTFTSSKRTVVDHQLRQAQTLEMIHALKTQGAVARITLSSILQLLRVLTVYSLHLLEVTRQLLHRTG